MCEGRFLVALVGMWDLRPYAEYLFSEANRTGIAQERRPKPKLRSGRAKDGEKLELYPLSLGDYPKND